jgi:hypothetical protein
LYDDNLCKELIEDYYEVKDLIVKVPSSDDIDVYGNHKVNDYLKIWGSWEKFLEYIGESPPISEELKQDLLKEYYEERELYSVVPSTEQIDEHGVYKIEDYVRAFGSWLEFLMYVERLDNSTGFNIKEKVSKEDLINNYYNLKQKLEHSPDYHEINIYGKFGIDFYSYHYGSYERFLSEINEKKTLKITDQQLIENYYCVKRKIGKQPSSTSLQDLGKFSYQVYLKRFGSYNNFLLTIGEPIVRGCSSITDEELFNEYLTVKKKLDREPSIDDINTNSKYHIKVYQRRFGSWINFKRELKEMLDISTLKI